MVNLFDTIKWALVLALIVALVAGIAGTIAGMGEEGTLWFYELQDTARGHVTSPDTETGLVNSIISYTFGYDYYGSGTYQGIIGIAFGFVIGMGALYMLYWAVRLIRAIVG